jgi:hypothetical protein
VQVQPVRWVWQVPDDKKSDWKLPRAFKWGLLPDWSNLTPWQSATFVLHSLWSQYSLYCTYLVLFSSQLKPVWVFYLVTVSCTVDVREIYRMFLLYSRYLPSFRSSVILLWRIRPMWQHRFATILNPGSINFTYLTKFIQQSPPSEADSFSASQ